MTKKLFQLLFTNSSMMLPEAFAFPPFAQPRHYLLLHTSKILVGGQIAV
jgi:hypothetical protein